MEQHGLVQVLRLNRPEVANLLNPEMLRELGRAFHESNTDDTTQVLVLTGAGERIFCAGMDLRAFSESDQGRVVAAVGARRLRTRTPRPRSISGRCPPSR